MRITHSVPDWLQTSFTRGATSTGTDCAELHASASKISLLYEGSPPEWRPCVAIYFLLTVMNSIQLVAPRLLEARRMPAPSDPGPGEVLVRLRAIGICGSDMHWYKEGGIGSSRAAYPSVLGHEPAGEIVAVGKGVDSVRVGQRVAVEPAITCGHCEFCRSGHHNNCIGSIFMGSPQMPGLFREYAVMPQRNVVPIPDAISFVGATILEPLSVMLHILELTDIHLGDTVAVMGAGPIGLLMASVARIAGAFAHLHRR